MMTKASMYAHKVTLVAGAALLVSGCARMPANQGLDGVAGHIEPGLVEPFKPNAESILTEDEVTRMLAFPLDMEAAEKIALHRNTALKRAVLEVGLAAADYAQAGRLENPGFSLARFSGEEYEASTLFDIGGLVLMPLKRQIMARQLRNSQYSAATEILRHLKETRDAWIIAVTEAQKTALMSEILEAIETSNQMTRQMTAIGHSSSRDAAKSEMMLNEFRAELSRQRIVEVAARETLIQQMGLWGSDASLMSLPERLRKQPEAMLAYQNIAQAAVEQRLDVQVSRLQMEAMAENLKLTRRSPFFSVIELGPVLEATEDERERGFELEFRLPLFDLGGVQNQRARIAFAQSQAELESAVVNAASQAREALHAYRRSWDIANAYDERILPLQEAIDGEELLRYNGMLISVFDLLDNAQNSMAMRLKYLDALRDFWLADNRLQFTLVAGGGDSMQVSVGTAASPAGNDADH